MMNQKWKQYLAEQAKRHPAMEPRDVYKMMYQAAFGAEHLLQDEEAARAYFQKEFEEITEGEEVLCEQIQENLYRVNLRAWKMRKLPAEWLFKMFVESAKTQEKQEFAEFVEIAKEAARESVFAFSYEDFLRYAEEYEKDGPRAVHHSEKYRESEKPAYRLVKGEYLRVLPILEVIAERKPKVVAIDGRCASGKSTMARMISEIAGASVVHTDDFFLPAELRTKERLEQPGGNVHYERFIEEVIPFLKRQSTFSYRRFDCSKMQLGDVREVTNPLLCVVEGAYSHHPFFGEYADLKVFSDIEAKVQLERIGKRDGEEMLAVFQERWIPMEENYFSVYSIRNNADIIL